MAEEYTDEDIAHLVRANHELAEANRREALAVAAGVQNRCYQTHRFGLVGHYRGRGEFTDPADGSRWLAIGHPAVGRPGWVDRHGYIEYVRLSDSPTNSE